MSKSRYKIQTAIILVFLFAVSAVCIFKKPQEYSATERRKLASFPSYSTNSVLNGSFSKGFEKYSVDQFPARDALRSLKALSKYYLLGMNDNNGVYYSQGYLATLDLKINDSSVENFIQKTENIYKNYLRDSDTRIFFSAIPDKNCFLSKQNRYPSLNYDALISSVVKNLSFATYIDITDTLEIGDYYRTDTHWRQENLTDTASLIARKMKIDTRIKQGFTLTDTAKPFYGVYYGQAALPVSPDELFYLNNDVIASCRVFNYETQEYNLVYPLEMLNSRDRYNLFLSGPSSLLKITNPQNSSGERLIVFRDSFGSSLVPLLCEAYSEIVLIDTRYIVSSLLPEYVDFNDSDILFLYSTLIINNSNVLK